VKHLLFLESFLKLCSYRTEAPGDAERTEDRRQTCRKLGSGVLGAQMEMHNSLVAFLLLFFYFAFFYALKLYFFPIL
jgi:hypothetical protein